MLRELDARPNSQNTAQTNAEHHAQQNEHGPAGVGVSFRETEGNEINRQNSVGVAKNGRSERAAHQACDGNE
ncbi:hypothetical protein ACQR1I_06390 [Bradyrhizobium sp. HKCCYLS2038]|uniref:hypothetical protein n=1 Tax=unclassified Bradyrhizobium TaxID=2631580 RepID=UPI003EBEC5A3